MSWIRSNRAAGGWILAFVAMVGLGIAAITRSRPKNENKHEHDVLRALVREHYLRVARALGVTPPPLILDNSVANAASDGKNVRVNIDWARSQLAMHCGDHEPCVHGLLVGVLAHELAHHRGRDAWAPVMERARREWLADFFSGYVLAALGYDCEYLERFLGDLAHCCSPDYPHPYERADAVRRGYKARSEYRDPANIPMQRIFV